MPNRIIKESINESKALGQAPPFVQDLYKRLITYADDYGRFNSDTEIMRARLYPRELDVVTEDDLIDALAELAASDKVRLYVGESERVDGVFGYFPNWSDHQRVRNSRVRWPEPGADKVNDWYLRRFVPIEMKVSICERDKFVCQECGKDFSLPGVPARRAIRLLNGAIHIDHIAPVQNGGRATEENLRVLCASCNLKRPRAANLEELVRLSADGGSSPRVAAKSGEARLARARLRAGAESESESESNPIQSECSPTPASKDSYISKKGRKLSGQKLEWFERFWEAFDYKQGKAEAADAWLDIKSFNDELAAKIVAKASMEAERRPALERSGRTPKMAQGWISSRRWEDEAATRGGRMTSSARPEQRDMFRSGDTDDEE